MGEARAGPVMNCVLHTRPVISGVLAETGGKLRLPLWVYRTGDEPRPGRDQRPVRNRVSDFGFTRPVISRVLAETSEKPRLRLWAECRRLQDQ